MRIATFLFLGVLYHPGLCDTSAADGDKAKQPNATPAVSLGNVTTSSVITTTASNAASTAGQTTQASTTTPAVPTIVNAVTSAGTMATANVMTTGNMTAAGETMPTAGTTTTATVMTTGPSPTTTTTLSITVATTSNQTIQPQPGVNLQSSTTLSVSTSSSPTVTPPIQTTTETTTVTVGTPSTDASMSTSYTTHSHTGMPQITQTQSPSTATTTVAVSQGAPGPSGEVTTGNGTNVPPKTADTKPKGGDSNEMVVYMRGQLDEKGNHVPFKVCEELMKSLQADTCTLAMNPVDGTIKSASVQVNPALLKELEEKHQQVEPPKNTILIAILCSCGALLAMTAGFIAYITCHRRSYRKNEQHLTEELQTVENGYHDNPTLEVMEVQPEMQEKKATLNGEFNDSWIVPFDTLGKDDVPEEEDTHL
ncbi:hypothetical protein SKAU_G00046060 [Synaphobranchus kaupii]|uniref:Podocalyxin n=1 Tax=Synaphobranchus kaupii TaxID=118154 RepID=A0A9Q1J874_SYNKA|nr:hypothetical protein SKAU_G00046060 [Synaphobranchus kaupii]